MQARRLVKQRLTVFSICHSALYFDSVDHIEEDTYEAVDEDKRAIKLTVLSTKTKSTRKYLAATDKKAVTLLSADVSIFATRRPLHTVIV